MSWNSRSERSEVRLDLTALGRSLRSNCPVVLFALVIGSSKDGTVSPGSDLDVTALVRDPSDPGSFNNIVDAVEKSVPGVEIDVALLNRDEPVF